MHLVLLPTSTPAPDEASAVLRSVASHPESEFLVLCEPDDAARLVAELPQRLHFKLWIAVKTPARPGTGGGLLPRSHAALVVLTHSAEPLRHTKTRIAYTYCPACGKTTKDYGGKKHTYHQYGTLISDVWRDIEVDPAGDVTPVIERLRDLFGIEPYKRLIVHDLRAEAAPSCRPSDSPAPASSPCRARPTKSTTPIVKLLNRDCLKALAGIPDSSIDYCFADPPYNIKKTYDRWDDSLDIREYFAWCDQWMDELCRVLRPGRSLTLINIPLWCVRHYRHLARPESEMRFQHWIAWDGLSLPVRMIMPAHYGILTFSKGKPRHLPGLSRPAGDDPAADAALRPLPEFYCLRASCISKHAAARDRATPPLTDLWHDIHRLKHNSNRVDHPCQLPPALMRRLIALYTHAGETVLDPFNGAGTTTLVATQLNRSAIGIELSKDYHLLARRRHEGLAAGLDPFAKSTGVPAAKNSRVQRLRRRHYDVPKKELQLEVKAIAARLGRLPTHDDVAAMSRHPIRYFDDYFISWAEVCAAARTTGMAETPARRDRTTR